MGYVPNGGPSDRVIVVWAGVLFSIPILMLIAAMMIESAR